MVGAPRKSNAGKTALLVLLTCSGVGLGVAFLLGLFDPWPRKTEFHASGRQHAVMLAGLFRICEERARYAIPVRPDGRSKALRLVHCMEQQGYYYKPESESRRAR